MQQMLPETERIYIAINTTDYSLYVFPVRATKAQRKAEV